ncbi:MAG: 23S rRNA (guanosine(2251)-2'-O)-methyltransferase RlmB [Alphaproteobacteria bacterium]
MSKKIISIYGTHAVLAALNNSRRDHKRLWLTEKSQGAFSKFLSHVPYKITDDKTLATMISKGAVHQGVVLETSALEDLSLEDIVDSLGEEACVVVLDQVTDPQNLGAILRSCAAFQVDALIVPEHHSPDFEGTIAKVASGALEQVPVLRVMNLSRALEFLKGHNFWCYGFAEEGKNVLGTYEISGRVALLFGAEGEGLRRLTKENCDVLIKLPTSKKFTTLNVAQTVSIAVFQVQKQKTFLL